MSEVVKQTLECKTEDVGWLLYLSFSLTTRDGPGISEPSHIGAIDQRVYH